MAVRVKMQAFPSSSMLSPRGLSPLGLSPRGLSPLRLPPRALSPGGFLPRGLSPPAGVRPGAVSSVRFLVSRNSSPARHQSCQHAKRQASCTALSDQSNTKSLSLGARQIFGAQPSPEGTGLPVLLNRQSSFSAARKPCPIQCQTAQASTRGGVSDEVAGGLGHTVKPGDVIFLKGEATGIWRIGATGGFMGHVVMVVRQPTRLGRQSEAHRTLQDAYPTPLPELWRIPTVESTRSEIGLHYTDMLAYASALSGSLVLLGELSRDGQVFALDQGEVQLWQSPSELRHRLTPELVTVVLRDMDADALDWSFATAARAVLLSASTLRGSSHDDISSEIKDCWKSEPICTSVVISFWQRFLYLLARSDEADAVDLILRWMPLKADRGLPGELLQSMGECGWHMSKYVPGHTSVSL